MNRLTKAAVFGAAAAISVSAAGAALSQSTVETSGQARTAEGAIGTLQTNARGHCTMATNFRGGGFDFSDLTVEYRGNASQSQPWYIARATVTCNGQDRPPSVEAMVGRARQL